MLATGIRVQPQINADANERDGDRQAKLLVSSAQDASKPADLEQNKIPDLAPSTPANR